MNEWKIEEANDLLILVDENDNEVGFADTITSALHHHFDRNTIRKNALELYGPEKIISEWEQLFKKMIFATSY